MNRLSVAAISTALLLSLGLAHADEAARPKRTGSFTITGKLVLQDGKPARNLPLHVVEADEGGGRFSLKVGANGGAIWAGQGKTTASGSFRIQARRNYFSGDAMRFFILCDYENWSLPVRNESNDAQLFTADEKSKTLNINKVAGRVIVEPGRPVY